MQPDKNKITIGDNINLIEKLINELVLQPRIKALEWSKITKQTPNMKIGYPGQHLASLVLGMEGCRTGARGNDIVDGSEVKSCSRVDASDVCRDCGEKISRMEEECPACGSQNIGRDNTSKWLFTIRSENDLKVLTQDVKRVVLVLADYPNFDEGNYNDIRFQVFEIWTASPRNACFTALMESYYHDIYQTHKAKNPAKTPAPKNFWPYSYQFYMCNPIKVFSCIVRNANTDPHIDNIHYVQPDTDRSTLPSEIMPSKVLATTEVEALGLMLEKAPKELIQSKLAPGKSIKDLHDAVHARFFSKVKFNTILPFIDEELREYLPLRISKGFEIAKKHVRK